MLRNYFAFFIISVSLILTSCVSKKKFTEMQTGRLNAEDMVRQLTDENNARALRIKTLIADFELMKNELMENNALKDQYIDSLNSQVFVLNEKMKLQSASLQETSFTLDFEKQQLTDAIQTKDKTIRSLKEAVSQLETENQAKSTLINNKNFDLNVLNEKMSLLESQKNTGEKSITDLQSNLEKVKAETEILKKQIAEKDATILKLENNVKLLKKEIGG